MTLNERISNDLKEALRSGDRTRLETLRMLRAGIIDLTKRGTDKEISADDELSVLTTAIKKRKEAIELYEKGGRDDLAARERREVEIITAYLPKQLSREEAEQVVQKIIMETGATSAKDFGKVMPLAMKELKGKVEGKLVQELVKAKLGVQP
ncbi:MAG: GatB/YqeY domain-containing protein [Ignavibacteria bacterium]|nr:GatB/YqeY domain-containing protein [Ignavibacteria bacterium]